MRHQRVAKKFGRSTKHRKMLMRSLVTNLILAESIKTTLPKAKEEVAELNKYAKSRAATPASSSSAPAGATPLRCASFSGSPRQRPRRP